MSLTSREPAAIHLTLRIPKSLVDRIDRFHEHLQSKHRLKVSRSDALRLLIEDRLASWETETPGAA